MCVSHSVVSDSLRPHELYGRFLCPWDSPGKNTEVGCQSLLQRIRFNPWVGRYPEKGMSTHSSILFREFMLENSCLEFRRSLVGYSPWTHKESDITEWLTLSLSYFKMSFPGGVVVKIHLSMQGIQPTSPIPVLKRFCGAANSQTQLSEYTHTHTHTHTHIYILHF